MSNLKYFCLVGAMLAMTATSLFAQVEKVDMSTDGIACGTCAAVAEVYLRRLDGVDKVAISKSREHVVVFYKAAAAFHPKDLREALRKTGVVVKEIQIEARGEVQEEAGSKVFASGQDKFLLVPSPDLRPVGAVSLQAILNDQTTPMELDVISFTPPQH